MRREEEEGADWGLRMTRSAAKEGSKGALISADLRWQNSVGFEVGGYRPRLGLSCPVGPEPELLVVAALSGLSCWAGLTLAALHLPPAAVAGPGKQGERDAAARRGGELGRCPASVHYPAKGTGSLHDALSFEALPSEGRRTGRWWRLGEGRGAGGRWWRLAEGRVGGRWWRLGEGGGADGREGEEEVNSVRSKGKLTWSTWGTVNGFGQS
ncbi:hypothetical protein Droror1_Dr00025462 [Drosera rotundifolia]